jgi:hypothetical protein
MTAYPSKLMLNIDQFLFIVLEVPGASASSSHVESVNLFQPILFFKFPSYKLEMENIEMPLYWGLEKYR